ncbi:HTH_Tnp_Tc3_2 domain-containing protein [Trichonephila clavipes]|nr:HTH_Tnp_Tc3_2 domain-containing protein [Trichonephila clavipes]
MSPGLACSLILIGHSYEECQVPITIKKTSLNDTISVVPKHCQPRVTTPNEELYWAVTAKRSRRSSAFGLYRQFSAATGKSVSRQIVYRHMGHIGLYAYMPVRYIPLTGEAYYCQRLAWSREHTMCVYVDIVTVSCVMIFGLGCSLIRVRISYGRTLSTRYH